MHVFWQIIIALLGIFTFLLIVRLVIEVVKSFARDWFPTGIIALILEGIFTVTDPPLKLLRKIVPPVTLGSVRLDLSYLILFVLIAVVRQVIAAFAL